MLNVLCSLEPVMSLKLISHGKSFCDSQKTEYVSIIYRCLMVEIVDKSIISSVQALKIVPIQYNTMLIYTYNM